MPEPRDHFQQRGWIETILRYIPGFRGYLEKEYRRDADRLYREYLAEQLRHARSALDRLGRQLVQQAQLDLLPELERITGRIDHLRSRIDGAVRGYSGFFDLVQITEETLDRVYAHDGALVNLCYDLAQQTKALQPGAEDLQAQLDRIAARVDELHEQWDSRDHILQGLV